MNNGRYYLPEVKIKTVNADFRVDEVFVEPHYVPQSEATFTYLWVSKENLSTFALQRTLAECFGLAAEDVSAAGLKDEQAITRQIISVRKMVETDDLEAINNAFANAGIRVSILYILGYGKKPVYPRKLHGNKFSIILRNIEASLADHVEARLGHTKLFRLINYYDEQRFGVPDSLHNTHLIGQALLTNDWQQAFQELVKSGNAEANEASRAIAAGSSPQAALLHTTRTKLAFFVSSYNSFRWNAALKALVQASGATIMVEFPYLGELALPGDRSLALPPMLSLDVEEKNWETLETQPKTKSRLVNVGVPVYLFDRQPDTYHHGREAMAVNFYLPTGCYATMLIKQLLVDVVHGSG
ncbi:MAG: tRNA pseudouridine(13) synthase TruD [Anaerolineae bacterium]|nr:tRNA pseudouridine(13) synthase TruD [Anaerolineae bacterium]